MASAKRGTEPKDSSLEDASLLDIVDHVLTKGVVLNGDLVLGVADVDLVYLRLSAVLCAADRVLGSVEPSRSRSARHARSGRTIAAKIGAPFSAKKR